MTRKLKWTGTVLQIIGAAVLALNVSWSGLAFLPMLAGAFIWLTIATVIGDGPLALLNLTFVAINIVGISRWL